MRGDVRIGISGWRYEPWRGTFYPKGLAQRRELEYASRAMPTIEINGSFYSLQARSSYRQWHDQTPEDFLFSIKGGRYITHMLRLRNVTAALGNFFASGVAELRDKQGPFLWQLPPNFQYDEALIDEFLSLLPRDNDDATALARRHDGKLRARAHCVYKTARPWRHALEVRHASFVVPRFIELLRRHRVAFVVADTAGKWPEYQDVTADFVYMRLHGADELYVSRYSDAALSRFARDIGCWRDGTEPKNARRIGDRAPPAHSRDVFCYFDNTDKVHAPDNAVHLALELAQPQP